MAFLKKVFRKLAYPLYFFVVFLVAFYWTFPLDKMKWFVAQKMEEGLAGNPEQPWLIPPRVQISGMNFWWISGVALNDVVLQPGSHSDTPASKWEFDTLKLRVGMFSTLLGSPKMEFDSQFYGGRARGAFKLDPKGGVSQFWLEMSNINLAAVTGMDSKLPVKGYLNLDADFNLGQDVAKDGKGSLSFSFKPLALGPGVLELPMPGMAGLTLPRIDLGEFSGKFLLKDGKGKTENFKMAGGKIEIGLDLDVELKKNLLFSPLNGSGWFRVDPQFIAANPNMGAILDLSPELKAAKDEQGRYLFGLRGTLGMPIPHLGKMGS